MKESEKMKGVFFSITFTSLVSLSLLIAFTSCLSIPSSNGSSNPTNATVPTPGPMTDTSMTTQEVTTLVNKITSAIGTIESMMSPNSTEVPVNVTIMSTTSLPRTEEPVYDNDDAVVTESKNPICKNWRETLDEHGKKLLILGDRDLVIPTTVEEIDAFCRKADESLKFMRNMIKSCFRPFARQVGALALNGAKKAQKSLCAMGRRRKEISIEDGRCIDTPEKKELLHSMMDDVVKICEEIRSDRVEVNMKMTYVCCYYDSYTKQSKTKFEQFCTKDAVRRTMEVFDIMLEDVLDLTCSDTKSNSIKCQKIFESNPIIIPTDRKPQAQSPLIPLMDIYTIVGAAPVDTPKKKSTKP